MKMRLWPEGRLAVQAPAKVNLFLEVLGTRTDGYHELETLMVTVTVYDTLVFQEDKSGAVEFRTLDAAIPQGPQNLVVRSALLVREETGSKAGVKIWLRKRIPVAAGLGGGSSDAAATLAATNRLWKLGLSLPDLSRLGARIGSDVPFFFHAPAAVARGRGELLSPVSLPRRLHLVVVCPEEGLSTAAVFKILPPIDSNERRRIEPVLQEIAHGNAASLSRHLFNRLEVTAVRLCPSIARARQAMQGAGLDGVFVTGSGSGLFGLAPDRAGAIKAARLIKERFPGRVLVTRTTS